MESVLTKRLKKLQRYLPLYILMVPGMLYLLINNYIPMAGLIIAFKKVNFTKGILGSDWVGFKNFEFLFQTKDAFIITRNTILYNGGFILLDTLVAVAIAILLSEIRGKLKFRFYQGTILLPNLISMVVVSYLGLAFLKMDTGMLNKTILPLFGMDEVMWYNEAKYWPLILTITHVWKSAGFYSVIFFAAVLGINPAYYEAATIDGANKWRQVVSITIPLIRPVIILMTMLGIGRIFYSDFGLFYNVPLNSGLIYRTTDVIDTYVFRGLMQLGDIGMASAAGLYQSLVGFTLVIVSNYLVRKFSRDDALF
ncbi:sugar ABC transporter permease [Cohnella fermenti]|uniref:Sugar ABC transporter permease n=2 Tax=Cohnella fermenti TaxID=2565925 RepID=A0A4S4BKV0_9BACL|nr:sugar ABC transporter permease [Cohnella fermenti]